MAKKHCKSSGVSQKGRNIIIKFLYHKKHTFEDKTETKYQKKSWEF